MWGTSSPGDKLTGDFGNKPDATSISDRGLFRLLAGNLSPGVFRLLQHNRHFCDMPVTLADVRSSGWTGKHLLVMSISGFEEPKPMMHGHEKSDLVIVAVKPTNKAKKAPCGGVCGGERSGVRWSEGRGPRGIRTSKARTGLRTRLACHRRWSVYGNLCRHTPEAGAVCGKAARTDLGGGRAMKCTSLPLLKRREFITLLGGAAAGWPLAARAQQAGRTYRVAIVAVNPTGGPGPVMGRGVPALLDELRQLGFSEGQNLTMDYRSTNQPVAQFALDLAEMVRAKPDVIVTGGAEPQLQAVMPVSGLIPVVFWANNFDPIERGYVKSLARPGGNLTGVFTRQPELAEKQVELLTQTFPERTRLGALWDAGTADQFSAAERRARALGRDLTAVKLETAPYDFEAAFRTLAEASSQALLVLSGPTFAFHTKTIVELALKYRLPGMFILRTYVDVGGLMSYGVDIDASFRRVANIVAKILNGARPGDLPVEQPVKYELVINLKTAKAIGIELPTSLLLRADEVIE